MNRIPCRVFLGLGRVPAGLGPTVVTVGNFDGVHRGHQALLRRVAAEAAARGLPAGAVTFDRHPVAVLRPGAAPKLLTTLRGRVRLLGEAGMDFVLVLPFTAELSRVPAERFATEVLLDGVGARAVVVGANFRFGHRAAGDAGLLAELGRERGVDVVALDLQADGGEAVSSTRIRTALAAGDVATAWRLLGRPHAVEGRVVHGDRRGRLLGMPTANLAVPGHLALPANGVYAGHFVLAGSGAAWPAATSVGTNPQFRTALRVEAHLLDFDGDLYGRRAGVGFEHRLRDEATFGSVDELVAQMREDVRLAGRLLTSEPARRPG